MIRDANERSWLDASTTLVVALVAAAASYGHMLDVALMAGEPLWIARAFPITVDGLVLAALRRGETGRPWLVLGVAASVASNVLAQFPDIAVNAGPVVAAWPPLALYGTHRLLLRRPETRPKPTPAKPKPATPTAPTEDVPHRVNGMDPLAARLEQMIATSGAVPSQRWVAENLGVGRNRAKALLDAVGEQQ